MRDLRSFLLVMHKILICSSDAMILSSPSWTALHQYTILPSSCLPQAHHPSVTLASSKTPPDSCICSIHLHPYTAHSSTLASDTIQLLLGQELPGDLNTNASENAHSSTQAVAHMSCITCVQSHRCHTHLSQMNTLSSLWSTAQGSPHGV